MFKRVFWYGSGVASGVAGSWWAKRKVRKQMERYTPQGMKRQATEKAAQRVDQAKGSASVVLADGRERMRKYRSDIDARRRRGSMHAVPDDQAKSGQNGTHRR